MDKLKRIAEKYEQTHEKKLMCSLVFDEMNVRRQIYFSSHQLEYVGYVDIEKPSIDGEDESTDKTIAKQAIVFMLNGINANFEFPVAYYFIDTLDQTQRKDLLDEIVKVVTEAGVKISNVTFDGYPSNIGMCAQLGADFDVFSPKFQPFFLIQ